MTIARDVQGTMFPDLVPARPQGWIMPSVFVGTNAELIAAVAPMYLPGSVLDVTYGDGKWWGRFTPDQFTAHDLYKLDGVDFRALPELDGSVDTVTFDPPYVSQGGSDSGTSRTEAFRDRFGLEQRADSTVHELIAAGVAEVCRVARRFVLVKCMEYTSGTFHDVPELVKAGARSHGWRIHDVIVHHTGSGPGGHNIFTPVRARRHHSYLLVFTPMHRRRGLPLPQPNETE